MSKPVDIKERLKKIEDSLFEANRPDRFDEKIKNLTPAERAKIDEILNIEISKFKIDTLLNIEISRLMRMKNSI